jgi:hypothetical protein
VKIVVVLGPTGSGKSTTLEKAWELRFGTCCFEAIDPLKNHLEETYGLSRGSLNTQEGKAEFVGNTGKTFQEVLVASFKFWKGVDPGYGAAMLRSQLRRIHHSWAEVWVSGVRSVAEAQAILDHVADINCDLVCVRFPGEGIETDRDLDEITEMLGGRVILGPLDLGFNLTENVAWSGFLDNIAGSEDDT